MAGPDLVYVRDRDFDFDPPQAVAEPVPEVDPDGSVIGWHWCRHEIENYLVDPAVVTVATGWPQADFVAALIDTARSLQHYEAARWTIGAAGRELPPHYELRTRPEAVDDARLQVPADLSAVASREWARDAARRFRGRVVDVLADERIDARFDEYRDRLGDALADAARVLVWYPGKDLLAALAGWLVARGVANAGAFRARMRDWVRDNPEPAANLLPEWQAFRIRLRA